METASQLPPVDTEDLGSEERAPDGAWAPEEAWAPKIEGRSLDDIIATLTEASRVRFANPFVSLEWPDSLEGGGGFMAPELVSLEGTEAWAELSPLTRMRLGFWELVNFFSLNIHGERLLCQGASRRLYRDVPDRLSSYLHHLLDEENKHMFYFGRFCQLYAGRTYPDRHIQLPSTRSQSEQDFLFFAEMLIFEEIVDAYNVAMAGDARLHPLVRQINLLHHRDEARHLAFGRALVTTMWHEQASAWPEEVRGDLVDTLRAFFTASWREYFNPNAYGDAGLARPMELRTVAWQSARSRERRRQLSGRCLRTFVRLGIDLEEGGA